MNRVQQILKQKTLLIITGVVIAMAIIGGPVLKEYIKCDDIAACEKSEKKEQKTPDTQVSSFDAIAPILQLNFDLSDVLLEIINVEYKSEKTGVLEYTRAAPQKFMKVLFRWIISPNAP